MGCWQSPRWEIRDIRGQTWIPHRETPREVLHIVVESLAQVLRSSLYKCSCSCFLPCENVIISFPAEGVIMNFRLWPPPKTKSRFALYKVGQNGFQSEGSAHSGICKMPLPLEFAHGNLEEKNMQFARVLRFWMPELFLSTSVHGTTPQLLSDLHPLIFLPPPLFKISNLKSEISHPSFALHPLPSALCLLPTANCQLPSEN